MYLLSLHIFSISHDVVHCPFINSTTVRLFGLFVMLGLSKQCWLRKGLSGSELHLLILTASPLRVRKFFLSKTMASTSGSIHNIEFGPPKSTWRMTARSKISLPEFITITWTNGKTGLACWPHQGWRWPHPWPHHWRHMHQG